MVTRERRKLPSWVREVVLAANGGFCTYCGSSGTRAEVVDHVDPVRAAGRDDITNLVPACRSCNSSKGSRAPLEWKAAQEELVRNTPEWKWDSLDARTPCFPEYVLSLTEAGLLEIVSDVQAEVLEAAKAFQARAAETSMAHARSFIASLGNVVDSTTRVRLLGFMRRHLDALDGTGQSAAAGQMAGRQLI
ncbi:HNH endonuclease [Kitasatospora acidiphila]|uniref:HNH endonuclease n=1 Tax=Kitasatospora acidiphila TaxID=2567942 RepID=A0A540W5U2_9ACTN|nr:HNH endonuclease signature motif containing protein [Kitasatospora acidiphila]TQF04382.1 HNH endonuclease [Kitasatospora acidiphila]